MNTLKRSLLISSSLLCLTHGVWAMENSPTENEEGRDRQIPRKTSLKPQKEGKHSAEEDQASKKKERFQIYHVKEEDLYYRDDDISEYVESFLKQNETFTYLDNCKYLLTSTKKEFCPIRDRVDGKDYIVAVTAAVDKQNASVNIEYFLDKDSHKGHMSGEDEQEKILEKLVNFKPISKENSYQELLYKIENIKEEEFRKNKNRLESIDDILNKSGKSIESAQEAFQEKLLTLRKIKKDVFDEIMPYFLTSQESYIKILFPYNINNSHWLTGEIWIHKEKNEYEIKVYAHDPYGNGHMEQENFEKFEAVITKRIKGSHPEAQFISIQNLQSPYTRRQAAEDGISCGVIAAEGLIKRIRGPLEDFCYPIGALELRRSHLKVVEENSPELEFIDRNKVKIDFINQPQKNEEEIKEEFLEELANRVYPTLYHTADIFKLLDTSGILRNLIKPLAQEPDTEVLLEEALSLLRDKSALKSFKKEAAKLKKDTPLVISIGSSQAGKTKLGEWLAGKRLDSKYDLNQNNRCIIKSPQEKACSRVESDTKTPNLLRCEYKDGLVYYVDCPGLGEIVQQFFCKFI